MAGLHDARERAATGAILASFRLERHVELGRAPGGRHLQYELEAALALSALLDRPLHAGPGGTEAITPEAPHAALSILLSCPKCGGPFSVDDQVSSVTCEHCGSWLLLEAPEREELCVAEG
jgi:hypothetical protein